MASARARSAAPTVSAARPTAMSSSTRCHSAGLVPRRAERDDRRLVEDEAGQLAGRVERRDERRRSAGGGRRLEQVRAHALLAARHDDGPVGGVAVHHEGLLAGEHPLRRLAAGPGAHGAERLAVALLAQGDGAAAGAGGQVAEQLGGAEGAGGQRGGDGGGEERARAAGCGPSAPARCTSRAARRRCRRGPRGRGGRSSRGRPASTTAPGVMPASSSASWRSRSGRTRARARCAPPLAARAARRRR